MRFWKLFVVLVCIMSVGMGGSMACAEEIRDTITVSGTAVREVAPDMATLQLSLEARGATAEAARSELATRTQALHNALLGELIGQRDIRTTGYHLGPEYRYDNNGKRHLEGYLATTSLSVQVKDLDRLGNVLDRCVTRAQAQVEGASFGLQDEGKAEREILAAAVENAKAKAGVIATAGGRQLGVLIRAQLHGDQGAQRLTRAANAMLMAKSAMEEDAMPETHLDPGLITVRISVDTVFSLVPVI